jgi:hypothetical protein
LCRKKIVLNDCVIARPNDIPDVIVNEGASSSNLFATTTQASSRDLFDITPPARGGWGAKIDDVVACVLAILRSSNEKILIFSQWSEVLDVVTFALERNEVKCQRLDRQPKAKHTQALLQQLDARQPNQVNGTVTVTGSATVSASTTTPVAKRGKKRSRDDAAATTGESSDSRSRRTSKSQQALQQFRSTNEVRVLLLPTHMGANGLNLIEATHVILVEPLLNLAVELQAINRVHRIGQTKQTFVHRFVIQNTVEEIVAQVAVKHKPDESSKKGLSRRESVPFKELRGLSASDLAELCLMLRQQSGERVVGDADAQKSNTATAAATEAFWEALIVYNGRSMIRRAAVELMERLAATEARVFGIADVEQDATQSVACSSYDSTPAPAASSAKATEVMVNVHGRQVEASIAEKIVSLKECSSSESN